MKNLFKWFGIISLAAIIVFSMAACDDGGGSGSGGGNTATYTGTADGETYTLKVTKSAAKYAAKSGDDYELTTGAKTSDGTVDGIASGVLTLKPSNANTPFTAAVSGSKLTKLDGTITWDDNTTSPAPGTLTGGGTTGGTNTGGGTSTLTLSGKVYTREFNLEGMMSGSGTANMFIYKPYTGENKTFSSNVGGTGTIKNGNLSFSVGAPKDSELESYLFETPSNEQTSKYSDLYSDAKCQPSDTRGISLDFDIDLMKENFNVNASGNSTFEIVSYVYVDRACTVTATGGKITEGGITTTFPNLKLSYKKGWNIVNMKATVKMSGTTGTANFAMSTGDSSACKWALELDEGYDFDF